MRTTSRRAFLGLMLIGLFVFATTGAVWALNGTYNRPIPSMDYVPQEVGIYDGHYADLTENECRQCHGHSLAGRHHNTEIVTQDLLCTPCHDLIPNPPGVLVYRNCVVDQGAAGCHSWDSVYFNGWHHNTASWDEPRSCVTCHKPNLVGPIGEFRSFEQYPPYTGEPTVFCCEDCHWDQAVTAGEPDPLDPAEAGHPSTFDHHDQYGNPVGYFWYEREILGNYDTHHMGFKGTVAAPCYRCHSADPNSPYWSPWNPELIRYCEVCHYPEVLMTTPQHVTASSNWEAVGFHTSYTGSEPAVYRPYTSYDKCMGCHPAGAVFELPPLLDDCSLYVPAINHGGGILPAQGSCGTIVTLRGERFGDEQYEDSFVQMRKSSSDPWTNIPVLSWTQNQIEFEIPCGTLTRGNYRVRLQVLCGESNEVGFALTNWCCLPQDWFRSGPCGSWITLRGYDGLGGSSKPSEGDGYNGRQCFVDFVGPEGTYTAKVYRNWTSHSVEVRFMDFFEDATPRNFVQDPTEADIKACSGLSPSIWQMQFVMVLYGDDDGSDSLTPGDTIVSVVPSDPFPFTVTDDVYIRKLGAQEVARGSRLRIVGFNFGAVPEGGQIRIGSKLAAEDAALGRGTVLDRNLVWSNTLVKVKLNVPASWQGKTRFVWVEKDGKKSNCQRVKILPAAP